MTSGNNIESEYLQLSAKDEWQIIYQRIRNQSYKDNICTEAVKPQNKILNRYRDVNPYDHSRIVLKRSSVDYINANLVKVERANRQYILTQGPLSNTYSHFWLMIWEQETKAVVMLNKLVEKKQDKCYQYWPSKIGSEYIMKLEDVGLTVEYLEQQDHSYYLTRLLRLTDTESGKSRDIIQFHYTTWPDFGVPCSPTAFLEFLKKVRDAGGLEADVGPAVVHCSAGIGRSGTFCLVDSCLVLIEKYGINSVDVKEILLEMRKYRMGLIQTAEQLRFSYQAIIEGTKQIFNQNSDDSRDNHLVISNNISPNVSEENSESEDEPPPLPPPRMESLNKTNGNGIDRPLPLIPKSISEDNGWNFENKEYGDEELLQPYIPSGPLPVVPGDELSEEDELEEEDDDDEEVRSDSPVSDQSDLTNSKQSSELRQRNRVERKEKLEAQVRDMKRRQQANEQWTQLKRSLYLPLVIGGTLILGGGLIAYIYFKD